MQKLRHSDLCPAALMLRGKDDFWRGAILVFPVLGGGKQMSMLASPFGSLWILSPRVRAQPNTSLVSLAHQSSHALGLRGENHLMATEPAQEIL